MTFFDSNGREILTGDVVRISNAYFKVDNGVYFVSDKGGDPSTCGTDITLHRLNRDGSLSAGKNKIAFWPLKAFCNDKMKNALSEDWNKANARIEVIDGHANGGVIEYFENGASNAFDRLDRIKWDWGKHSSEYVRTDRIRRHYLSVANRLKGVA